MSDAGIGHSHPDYLSASSLLKLAQHAFKLDEKSDRLTFKELSHCEGLLGALPAEEIAQRFEQRLV